MALNYAERVKETTRTTGTGTLSLDGAVSGFRTFVAGIGTTNECTYVIVHEGIAWEVGHGTVTDASPDTLSRNVLASSNAGALVNFAAGIKVVLNAPTANKFEEAVNVRDFGATGDGTTDDSAAIQAAIDAIPTTGGNVYLPSGVYRVDTGLVITTQDTGFIGDGPQQTQITTAVVGLNMLTVGDGLTVIGRTTIRGILFRHTDPGNSTGSGVDLRFNNTTWLSHVMFDGFQQNLRLREGCFNIRMWQFRMNNTSFGVHVANVSAGGSIATDLYLTEGIIDPGGTTGTGIHLQNCAGVQVLNVETLGGNVGVAIVPGNGDSVRFCFFTHVITDTANGRCWSINPTGTGEVLSITCTNCWAASSRTQDGILIGGNDTTHVDGFRWADGRVVNNFRHGILINGGGTVFRNIRISDSDIGMNSIRGSALDSGIAVNQGASDFSLIGNKCGQFARAAGAGSNLQRFGITVLDFASDNYIITGNDCTGNVTAGISDAGTGTTKIVKDNIVAASNIPSIPSGTPISLITTGGASAISVTGLTDIETITLGYEGQRLTIIWAAGATFGVVETGNIALDAALAAGAATDTLTLIYDGATWLETSRSTNA